MNNQQQNILIIGAGLCGSLLALRLGQRGYNVSVYEMRDDLRTKDISAGRSINLAFSDRGNKGIKLVGLEDKVKKLCIPMNGRMLHDKQGNTFLSNYSGRAHEYINSISRGELNRLLLTEAEKHDNVTIHFNKRCQSVDFEKTTATFEDCNTKGIFIEDADAIIATDGAGSALRKSYYLERKFLFSFSQDYLTHGYKELSILPTSSGTYKTYKNALHIWPRGDFMIIALPNLDGSFTVTLFLSYSDGKYNFNNLTTPEIVTEFFQSEFPDALELMPNLAEDFFKNPTAPLGTVKCSPWHYKGNTLLMGDSAHAIVPFYGQGMNAGFEDTTVMNDLMIKHNHDWDKIFAEYSVVRKPDGDGLQDLSLHNYHVMRDYVADPKFLLQKKIEAQFAEKYPDKWMPLYSMTTFSDIRYSVAWKEGQRQQSIMDEVMAMPNIEAKWDSKEVEEMMLALLAR